MLRLDRVPVTAMVTTLLAPVVVVLQTLAPSTAAAAGASPIGSLPVGATAYRVPSGAVFAVAHGGTGGRGTRSSPYQSAQTAVDRAPNGATVVLRRGTYRETLRIPFNKRLTIQSFPHEAVWFDGAQRVTGWVRSGSTWVRTGWDHVFDARVSLAPGADERSRYLDSRYPMAGDPSAVWVSGRELRQVASQSAVGRGTFWVDRTNHRLVIGDDPTGRSVMASTLTRAMEVQGRGTTIRGIGVRRYATPLSKQGTISYQVDDLTFENMVVRDNATIGIFGWGDRATFRHMTVEGNGILGVHADSAPGFRLVSSKVRFNNDQHFNEQPISAGVKLTNSDGVLVSRNIISDNHAMGLWLDGSMRHVRIVGNRIHRNSASGVLVELSGHTVVANNYLARNREGITLFDSNDVAVWNNTLNRNSRTLQVLQDERRQSRSSLVPVVPWVTSDISVHNNVAAYGTNSCPLLTLDLTRRWNGADFGVRSNGNVFHRTSSTSPRKFGCWASRSTGTTGYTDLGSWRRGTGNDGASRLFHGSSVLTSRGSLTAAARSGTGSVARGLPTAVARAIGRPAGERFLGAYLVR